MKYQWAKNNNNDSMLVYYMIFCQPLTARIDNRSKYFLFSNFKPLLEYI